MKITEKKTRDDKGVGKRRVRTRGTEKRSGRWLDKAMVNVER